MRWTCLLVCGMASPLRAQSAVIDWSRVEVDSDGHAIFEPRVSVPEPDPPDIDKLTGYYANADGFYGRPTFIEYLHVRRGDDGRIEALKIVGDHNVPRGRLSWRTARGQVEEPSWRMPIQLQLRDDVHDEEGFWWSPGQHHEIEWEPGYAAYHLLGQNPSPRTRNALFYRVSEAEAREAARTHSDAP